MTCLPKRHLILYFYFLYIISEEAEARTSQPQLTAAGDQIRSELVETSLLKLRAHAPSSRGFVSRTLRCTRADEERIQRAHSGWSTNFISVMSLRCACTQRLSRSFNHKWNRNSAHVFLALPRLCHSVCRSFAATRVRMRAQTCPNVLRMLPGLLNSELPGSPLSPN